MAEAIDISGKIFGYLTALYRYGTAHGKTKRPSGKQWSAGATWLCQCVCGKTKVVLCSNLRNGSTKSCGCLSATMQSKNQTIHGNPPEYSVWAGMIQRCYNPKETASFSRYGARGISVCDKWKCNFLSFFADMGPRPSPKHTLERIDNDGNYEPSNCRWATRTEQARNRRSTRYIEFRGQTKPLAEWAEVLGISVWKLRWRLDRGLELATDYEPHKVAGHLSEAIGGRYR